MAIKNNYAESSANNYMTFKELNIIEPILKALNEKGYENPTLIQERAIPVALNNKDILGLAQTGTGKQPLLPSPSYNNYIKAIKIISTNKREKSKR